MKPDDPDHHGYIKVEGAREHNLQNVNVQIPRNSLVVITGLSGSGKSSLAFDTLYAEGQRRYVESLSAYARQFLEQMSKPDVDSIEGLSPAISIEQRTVSNSPRSTVGTSTEIYDHLRLLYARAGDPYCPKCDRPISSQTVQQMTERVMSLGVGARIEIFAPVVRGRKGEYKKDLDRFRSQGFVRIRIDGTIMNLSDDIALDRNVTHDLDLMIDRIVVKEESRTRISDSLEITTRLAEGLVKLDITDKEEWLLSENNACLNCGISLPEIAPRLFSFNNPHGACPSCGGLGNVYSFDPDKVVPDPSLALNKGAIAPWRNRTNLRYYEALLSSLGHTLGFTLDIPWSHLRKPLQKAILFGTGKKEIEFEFKRRGRTQRVKRCFDGVMGDLQRRSLEQSDKPNALSRFQSTSRCSDCNGSRLCRAARAVKVDNYTIDELASFSVERLGSFLESLKLPAGRQEIAERILREIRERLHFLSDVGLGYLTLDRPSRTLSGGEGQRIRLATQIGSSLMGVLYILDEPSIGLHSRDQKRLLESLERLRDSGNSVIVVEHDEETIRAADYVIDMGPGSGNEGGAIVAQGTPKEVSAHPHSPTGAYLSGRSSIETPKKRRLRGDRWLTLEGCCENNLKQLKTAIPLGQFVAVTGVSGSGKSTLVNDILCRALSQRLHGSKEIPGQFTQIGGLQWLDKVIDVSQAPIGRTPRSNPATYSGAFDGIRKLFSQVPEARVRGYKPGRFSFNVKGGRCESCRGDGVLRIEMHFLPDIYVTCEVCSGRRYNLETLEITYKGRNIADILEMTVEEAVIFLGNVPNVRRPLESLQEVGLGYLHLGQPATTLSGGEAQRVKLSRELSRLSTGRTLYLLDEPTTGLHFSDVERLLLVLQRLVDRGNTVLVIEHQLDVIKSADYVIDLGPEGGEEGGRIVTEGTPEQVARCPRSYTGRALSTHLGRNHS